MLVLARRVDEVIMIGDDISITVIKLVDGRVRLGIQAPKEIPVHRLEVYDAIHGRDDDAG
jgi:carbon storage regulator